MAADTAITGMPRPSVAAQRARRARRRRSVAGTVATYVILVLASLLVLFPLYILVVGSILNPAQLITSPPTLFPTHPAWSNYALALKSPDDIGLYLRNSAIQTGIIVSAQLVTSVLAAYALVFVKIPFQRTIFLVILGTVMIPFEVTVAANYVTVQDLNWNANFLGLTAPFFATGFGIFLLRQAFLSIPRELREAAVIDGYGHLRFLWRIAIPLARPIIAALAVFSFLGAWNQYLWPELLTPGNPSIETVQIGLQSISGDASTETVVLAASVLAIAPLLVLLIFFRKNLIRSLTAGAVK